MHSPCNLSIQGKCPHCKKWTTARSVSDQTEIRCQHCQKNIWQHPTEALVKKGVLDQCPLCGCQHLYRQKDFNRKLGIGLIVVGVVLSYFTYGISLLLVTIIDAVLYRSVGEVGICYLCQSNFRDEAGKKGPTIPALPVFNLSLEDHFRALRERIA